MKSSSRQWKAQVILEAIGKTDYLQTDLEFVDSVINRGKTDHTERAKEICLYFKVEGKETPIYDKLCELSKEY